MCFLHRLLEITSNLGKTASPKCLFFSAQVSKRFPVLLFSCFSTRQRPVENITFKKHVAPDPPEGLIVNLRQDQLRILGICGGYVGPRIRRATRG